MKSLKFLAYILLIFGTICEFAGVFVIIDDLRGDGKLFGLHWSVGLCICLLGTINVVGFKLIQLRAFPPK